MSAPCPQPWIASALELLDLRREDRVLLIGIDQPGVVRAVRNAVGGVGTVVALTERAELLHAVIESGEADVVAGRPDGHERLGAFDALLGAPITEPGWELTIWSRLVRNNLRPGGRFVLDLPAEVLSEDLLSAWSSVGGDDRALGPLFGPTESELAEALRGTGLRRVEVVLATHLVAFDSPLALAQFGWESLETAGADPALADSFSRRLVETLATTGPVEIVFKRTRVHGIR